MSDSAGGAEGTRGILRVLVVDDAEDIRDLTVRMVTKLGHVADQAADGVEAVEALAARHYDLILLDLSMPRMTGEEVVRWMREHPEHGDHVRIVVVSAWAGDHRPTLNELGVTDVLPKPFRRQQLVEVLDQTTPMENG
jgi:CheY-like chemotaxis protein